MSPVVLRSSVMLISVPSSYRRPIINGHAADPDVQITASDCFETVLEVQLPDGPGSSFRVYYTPPKPASDRDNDDARPVCFVCHHGAGYSGLSFALFAKAVRQASAGKAGVLALDCRGHGAGTPEAQMDRV